MSIFGKCSLKSALSFVIEERHDLRDHLVGSFLHQTVTEPCTTVPDTLVATSFAWLMRNVPDAFSGATQYFPQARIVFDKFHVAVLAGQALDEVRRELQREGADLKGAMWSLRGNAWNLSEERQEQRKNLSRQYTKLGRAMSLRETLQAIYASSDRLVAEAELDWWCGWAERSRLGSFSHLAKTVRQHREGILAYFDTHLTSAAIEAVNGVIQLAKRMARGFKNFLYFRTAVYHRGAKLKLAVPAMT
jgi:transposase